MGPFDRMFDRNGDGSLDSFERAMEMDFIDYVNRDGFYEEKSSHDDFDDLDDLDEDEFDGDEFDDDDFDGDEFDDDF